MNLDQIERAAAMLADMRARSYPMEPLEDLPENIRPPDLMAAYGVQARLRELLAERSPGPQMGWKIGCTTPVMQEYLKIPHPCAGTLYRGSIQREVGTLVSSDYMVLGLECEIAVQLARDLPQKTSTYETEDMHDAVAGVMASVEVVEHRFRDFLTASTPSLVADDFFSAGCIVGRPVPPDVAGDLRTLRGGFSVGGKRPTETGAGVEILGNPLTALAWLAEQAAQLGTPLEEGQVVTLGSVVKTIYPEPGTRIEARFTRLPTVKVDVI
ncbi:MAG: fumarylacetoacetate hydrolase family protein [Pseudomonadota bacterium]